jgi:hypothetical protein
MIRKMTIEQLSRAGVALRLDLEIPPDSGKHYLLVLAPTRDLRKAQASAKEGEIVATYTEFEGICRAHARSGDDRINIDSIIALVGFRERAEKEGVPLMTMKVGAAGEKWPD